MFDPCPKIDNQICPVCVKGLYCGQATTPNKISDMKKCPINKEKPKQATIYDINEVKNELR